MDEGGGSFCAWWDPCYFVVFRKFVTFRSLFWEEGKLSMPVPGNYCPLSIVFSLFVFLCFVPPFFTNFFLALFWAFFSPFFFSLLLVVFTFLPAVRAPSLL